MKVLQDYSDNRQRGFCIYCGGPTESRDHVPSRYLLDDPLPANVHVVPACEECNRGFSRDEEFAGCLLDVWRTGPIMDALKLRPKIRATLERNPRLAMSIIETLNAGPDSLAWKLALPRLESVVVKLAQGHAAFDLGESTLWDAIPSVEFAPFSAVDSASRDRFENASWPNALWPEAGTRAMQHLANGDDGWVIVQDGNYRYHASTDDLRHRVRIVILESFACDVTFREAESVWPSTILSR